MSSSIFLVSNIPETQNPNYIQNPNYTCMRNNDFDHHDQDFEISDFFALIDDHLDEGSKLSFSTPCISQTPISQEISSGNSVNSIRDVPINNHMQVSKKRDKKDVGLRVAFKTKSELEIMDDGFKWRKYGKKMVKDSPNPRNYYKCASGGCKVKKRVERDREDSSYVITAYDGRHNHESPSVMYYNQMPLSLPRGWTLQPLPPPSSS